MEKLIPDMTDRMDDAPGDGASPSEDLALGDVSAPSDAADLTDSQIHSAAVAAEAEVEEEVAGGESMLEAEALDADTLTGVRPLPEVLPVPASVLRLAELRLSRATPDARSTLLPG